MDPSISSFNMTGISEYHRVRIKLIVREARTIEYEQPLTFYCRIVCNLYGFEALERIEIASRYFRLYLPLPSRPTLNSRYVSQSRRTVKLSTVSEEIKTSLQARDEKFD